MEYKIVTPEDAQYPQKLIQRLGDKCPEKIYYNGPLDLLKHFSMAVICSDESGGITLMETNQILFTVREYKLNYLGPWQSVIETEIFRLGLFKKYTTVTLFTSKGLKQETFDSFLLDRFYPPLHEFPERDEYFRRVKEGELLMLSITDPDEKRQLRKNIMGRNWIACNLGDIVFIPYAPKGTKTYTTAKKIARTDIPVFTIDHAESSDLHKLGIPGLNRKTVKAFLEEKGAKVWVPPGPERYEIPEIPVKKEPDIKRPTQIEMNFKGVREKGSSFKHKK